MQPYELVASVRAERPGDDVATEEAAAGRPGAISFQLAVGAAMSAASRTEIVLMETYHG